jgi:hypothetical protein
MIERLDQDRPQAILIWSGENVSETTFLAMACWWLEGRAEQLLRVIIPATDARRYVAAHSPDELADLFTSARALTDTERANLAEDFVRICGETGLLRRNFGLLVLGGAGAFCWRTNVANSSRSTAVCLAVTCTTIAKADDVDCRTGR